METIVLHKPDKKWSDAFQRFKMILSEQSKGMFLAIEHIGSTSIDNMPAKDIVDVQCAVENFEQMTEIRNVLDKMGFQMNDTFHQDHVPFQPSDYFHPDWEKRFFKGCFENQAFNIHIRKIDGKNWQFALAFRDNLRQNKQLRTAYLQCKERLMNAGVTLKDYCLIKDSFIDLMSLQFANDSCH